MSRALDDRQAFVSITDPLERIQWIARAFAHENYMKRIGNPNHDTSSYHLSLLKSDYEEAKAQMEQDPKKIPPVRMDKVGWNAREYTLLIPNIERNEAILAELTTAEKGRGLKHL